MDKLKRISTIALILSALNIVGYGIACIIFHIRTGVELTPTMTPYWFGFWGTEIGACMLITIVKVLMKKKPTDADNTAVEEEIVNV